MLNAAEDLARTRGWLVISEDVPSAGLLGRVARAAAQLLSELETNPDKRITSRRIKSVTTAGVGVEFEQTSEPDKANFGTTEDLRNVLSELGDILSNTGSGLIITLDELLNADINEIRQFGSVIQHVCRREQRPVAFVGAALPHFEEELDVSDTATFLQRCSRYDIGQLDTAATRFAIAKPIRDRGVSIDSEALNDAVAATSGYAFMV